MNGITEAQQDKLSQLSQQLEVPYFNLWDEMKSDEAYTLIATMIKKVASIKHKEKAKNGNGETKSKSNEERLVIALEKIADILNTRLGGN